MFLSVQSYVGVYMHLSAAASHSCLEDLPAQTHKFTCLALISENEKFNGILSVHQKKKSPRLLAG